MKQPTKPFCGKCDHYHSEDEVCGTCEICKCKCDNLKHGDLITIDDNGRCTGCGRELPSVSTPTNSENWEKEFDEEFPNCLLLISD